MTDRQSKPQDKESPGVDAEVRFLKSLSAVFKDNRDVLTRLPELIEQCLNKEHQNPSLAESPHEEENREGDVERLAERKQSDLERKLESMEYDKDVKNKRIATLDKTIKDKTATLEAMRSEENTLISTKDRKSMEIELKKRDKQQEASEKQVKCLEEEISAVKKESEKKVKKMSDKVQVLENDLLKKEDELQRMYDEYDKAIKTHKSSYDAMINELAAKEEKIQAYTQNLSKMKEDLTDAHTKMDLYKSRLASLSEKRVKQDQRLVEDTLGLNRQSQLERDFSTFFDGDRMDACEKMQSIYHNKEHTYLYVYYPRLACIIFETAYEQVKEAKEAATDFFKELVKIMIDFAPSMGQKFSKARKDQLRVCTATLNANTWSDGSECSKDVIDGMMLSLKEAAHTCNLDHFVESVLTIAYEKWKKWCLEDKSCFFTPAWHLMQDLDKYIKACIRLTWRMVTQVPPMKLEFHCSKFNKDIHKNVEYHSSFTRYTRNNQPPHQDQDQEIACYLWPGLQDGGGRLIRAGEVICKVKEP